MKIAVSAVIVLLVCCAAFLGYTVYRSYDRVAYYDQIVEYTARGLNDDSGYAEFEGVKTHLSSGNLEMLQTLLTITERKQVSEAEAEKSIQSGEVIRVTLCEDAEITAVKPDPDVDIVYLITAFGGKTRCFKLENYRIYERLYDFVCENGQYGHNERV